MWVRAISFAFGTGFSGGDDKFDGRCGDPLVVAFFGILVLVCRACRHGCPVLIFCVVSSVRLNDSFSGAVVICWSSFICLP